MKKTVKREKPLPVREPAPGSDNRTLIKKAWKIYRDPDTAAETKRMMILALDQFIEKL